jgi:hypothetical protein
MPWRMPRRLSEEMTMNGAIQKYVNQVRAAILLGISEPELCRISQESGFGHRERKGEREELFFTYEELRRICQITTHVVH